VIPRSFIPESAYSSPAGQKSVVNYRSRRRGRVLMWILLVILALIVASLLFGGFQKGTKSTLPAPASTSASLPKAHPAPL